MRFIFTLSILQLLPLVGLSQKTVSALFLGNSYTHRNNMPQLVERFASSQGHNLVFETYAPAGYTLNSHSTDEETIKRINKRNWQFVVLQEQSQLPSFPNADVAQFVYPALMKLNSAIKQNSECTLPAMYRTWGRKNGDSKNCDVWPPVCTYYGMDSLLGLRYRKMADTTNGIVVPVGDVWKKFRALYPTVELYKADESHPSAVGSYLIACCFYSAFYREDPTKSDFKASLADSTAARIKRLTKWLVYNKLNYWNIGKKDPVAAFDILENNKGNVKVVSTNQNSFQNNWYFGDATTNYNDSAFHGDTSNFIFEKSGRYRVHLQSVGCFRVDTITKWIKVNVDPVNEMEVDVESVVISNFENSILISGNKSFIDLRVYDLNGKMLESHAFTENITINKTSLPRVFVIELKSKKESVRKLFIK